MKKHITYMLTIGSITLCGLLPAKTSAAPAPGYQYIYDASSGYLPNNTNLDQPAWTKFWGESPYTSTATVGSDLLTINAPASQYLIFRMGTGSAGADYKSWNPVYGTASTVEFSARVNTTNNGAQAISLMTASNSFVFDLGATKLFTHLGFGTGSYDLANTNSFNIYRIVLTATNTASVYVNDTLAFTTAGKGSGGTAYMDFGNGFANLSGGTVDYEYIQWTNAGVVPEPSSILLLSFAGATLLGVWLRRFTRYA